MFFVRPIKKEDLDEVYELAKKTGPGMTSLPTDKKLLEEKIQDSINSFQINPTQPRNEAYRFVLVNSSNKKIYGISAIRARIGGYEPFYSYQIKTALHESKELNVKKEVEYLELKEDFDGPSIISSLFLDPELRGQKLGGLLSAARFFHMADNPNRFTDSVIAEMRGYINKESKSPFWEGTVKHFFDMEFDQADNLSAKDKGFIADLMPKYPIYLPLLPKDVFEVIAKVHDDTKPALEYLKKQGFTFDGHVDIFDAGPRIAAKVQEIKLISESKILSLKTTPELDDNIRPRILGNPNNSFYTQAKASIKEDKVLVEESIMKILEASEGSEIRIF
jgi:arginine N-succinyltransferase